MGVKLYFYSLETTKDGKPLLKTEPCKAESKDGLIRPVNGEFFPPAVGGFTLECHIGKVVGKKDAPVVILTEPDLKLARQLLAEHVHKRITRYQEKINIWKNMLKVVGV